MNSAPLSHNPYNVAHRAEVGSDQLLELAVAVGRAVLGEPRAVDMLSGQRLTLRG